MHTMLTLDSADSVDLDDGFHIAEAPNNGWLLSIFIAAPAAHLSYNSPLTKKAEERVLTQYRGSTIKQAMIDDEKLNDSCALLPGTGKSAVKLSIEINEEGEAVSHDPEFITRVLNVGKLNYVDFDEIQKDPTHVHHEQIALASACARRLFYSRTHGQDSLSFVDEENGIFTDEEGNIKNVSLREIHGQITIQEFMILSNTLFTQWAKSKNLPIIYRNHEPMNLQEFKKSNAKLYNEFKCLDKSSFKAITKNLLKQARYSIQNRGHCGLGLSAYATFSSPLRRYPDLHNQFVTLNALNGIQGPAISKDACEGLNARIAAIKKNDHEGAKKMAGVAAMRSFEQSGELSPNQFYQVIKRHTSRDAKIKACEHFVSNRKLHSSFQVWKGLISFPFAPPVALSASMMEIFDNSLMGENLWRNLQTQIPTVFIEHGIIESYHHERFRALVMSALSIKTDAVQTPIKKSAKNDAATQEDNAMQNNNTEFNKAMNYKGAVLELCLSKNITLPAVEFINKGLSHAPVWHATMQLALTSLPATIEAKDTSKKTAEANIFYQILTILQKETNEESPATSSVTKIAETDNAKSILNQYCQQHKLAMPVFKTTPSGSGFSCLVYVPGDNHDFPRGQGYAPRKKDAEKNACDDLLNNFEGNIESPPKTQVAVPSTPVTGNAKSMLFEMQSKKQVTNLSFTTKPDSGGFVATCALSFNGNSLAFDGNNKPTKKAAEHDAAARMYHVLSKTVGA